MISKMTLTTTKGSSPIDVTRFHQVLGDTKDEYSEILAEYINQMNDNLQRLDAAVNTHDHREVEMISHRCVGTSATCGMTAVVAPLRELERAGRTGCLDDARPLFEKVEAGFENICAFLNDYSPQPA
jgi:HPt (histidine-containing phosphotransfer) domain-containing protein